VQGLAVGRIAGVDAWFDLQGTERHGSCWPRVAVGDAASHGPERDETEPICIN
jgi:hypothetical protein